MTLQHSQLQQYPLL